MGAVRAHNKTKRTQCVPSEFPSFVYRQDGHELSYLITFEVYTKTGKLSRYSLPILDFLRILCYSFCGATSNGRRFPLSGGIFLPPIERKGVVDLVTWTELIQFGIFLIALISLIRQDKENKK